LSLFIVPLDLSGHSRLSYHRSSCFAFYEHPIIASEESQRNPGNSALFGIKNARRSAGEDEFVVARGIDQHLPVGSPAWLEDDDIAFGDHVIQLTGPGK
jgi:hypothetical protein